MAPELRKKKSKVAAKAEPELETKSAKATPSRKRKAAVEAAAEHPKKARSAPSKKSKKSKADSEPTKKSTTKEQDKGKKEEMALVARDDTDDIIDIDVADDDTQNLVAEIDPEEDDGQDSGFKPGQDVGKIPEISKKNKKKAKATANGVKEDPGVVYVGHIPHGFYEHEMRQYFSQFGPVTRLRLSRNRKTGASKHFAFIEFAEESTAEIAAKTMDTYLMFGRILKCKVVPREKLHDKLWEGANRRFKKLPRSKLAASQLSRPLTQGGWEKRVAKEEKRRSARAKKLEELGYEFEAPKLLEVPPPAPVSTVSKGVEEAAKGAAAA